MWARRLIIGSGMAVTSLVMVSGFTGTAGAASLTPTTIASMTTPCGGTTSTTAPTSGGTTSGTSADCSPTVAATSDGPAPTSLPYTSSVKPATAASSSLPFTGADVEGLAVVGGAAVVAGALLLRRRRQAA